MFFSLYHLQKNSPRGLSALTVILKEFSKENIKCQSVSFMRYVASKEKLHHVRWTFSIKYTEQTVSSHVLNKNQYFKHGFWVKYGTYLSTHSVNKSKKGLTLIGLI